MIMKILVQHNFSSGLGDFTRNIVQYMYLLRPCKDMGYEINLYINLRGNKYVDRPFFKKLFSEKTYNFFNSIVESPNAITSKVLNEYNYVLSAHDPQSPGIHQWDLFTDNSNLTDFKLIRTDAGHILINNIKIDNFIFFSEEVESRVTDFLKKYPKPFDIIHIRTSDIIDKTTHRYDEIISKILNLISNKSEYFYLATNNKYIFNKLKQEEKIIFYEFKNIDKYSNDINAFTFIDSKFNNNEDDSLINRLFDTTSEMAIFRHSKNIYCYSDLGWVSNFLFYPIYFSKNSINLINI